MSRASSSRRSANSSRLSPCSLRSWPEGDVLAQRALEIEHVAVLALEVHVASAGVDDLAEFFDFFDVLEFHVHCLPCNFLL